MEDVWFDSINGGCWERHLFLRPNGWELDIVKQFLSRLEGRRVCKDEKDWFMWTKVRNKSFLVKGLHNELENKWIPNFVLPSCI